MKILLLSCRMDRGGGPKHIYDLIKWLNKKRDWDISLAAPSQDHYTSKLKSETPEKTKIFHIPNRKTSFFSLTKTIAYSKSFDIIHTHGRGAAVYGLFISKLFPHKKIIHTYHGISSKSQKNPKIYILDFFENAIGRSSNAVSIFVSEAELNQYKHKHGFIPRQFHVIENGVQIPLKLTPRSFNRSKEITFAHCTRFDKQKNFDLLINIAKALSKKKINFKINVLGDGEQAAYYIKEVEKNGLSENFDFAGFTENTTPFFLKSDFYVSTSLWEGLPLAVLEAMATGCIPILSDCPGNSEISSQISGDCKFSLSNATSEFIEKIENLYQTQLHSISNASANLIKKKYSIEKQIDATIKVYENFS